MRKKWLAVALAVGLSGALVWGMGISASAENRGLDVYKSALQQTKEAKSKTAQAKLELTDNGVKLLTLEGIAKVNHDENVASLDATYTDADGTGTFQAFHEQDQVVFKKGDSDVYRVMETKDWGRKSEKHTQDGPPAFVKQLFPALLGDMNQWTTVTELPDGGKQVTLELSEEEMPAFIKVIAPAVYAKMAEHGEAKPVAEKSLTVKLPNLKEEVQVDAITVQATINKNNLIEKQTAEVHLSGVDASGKKHELLLSIDVSLSDLAATTPDHIDLAGKQVEKISQEDMKARWGKGEGGHRS
ncbi:hypothetical protein [uncultured Brevibacillus sp.]|uniref:hypothetical protein n=1 Tax=uncultured Brevibacillus sp. TaxID=169970 RepID=UPI002591D6D1|nr:hypothetical protein [uncultured Brevibacillus sp.]